MFDELRFVTRNETFNDLAVRELAQTRARCLCLVQNGRCKKNECAKCITFKRYFQCFSQMSEYDRLRLQNYTCQYYSKFSENPTSFMNHKEYCRTYKKIIKLIIACLAGFIFMGGLAIAGETKIREVRTRTEISEAYYEIIQDIFTKMKISRFYGIDITGDGQFNCIDRALLFKLLWDDRICSDLLEENSRTPEQLLNRASLFCASCELVRNYNPATDLNHLFVMIYDAGADKYITIEPDVNWKDQFLIKEVWEEKYDPKANNYDETDYYMSKLNPKMRRIFRTVSL